MSLPARLAPALAVLVAAAFLASAAPGPGGDPANGPVVPTNGPEAQGDGPDRPAADPSGDRASFAVAYGGVAVPWRVFLLQAMPGEEVRIEVRPTADALGAPARAPQEAPAGDYRLRASSGRVDSTGPRAWRWTAPDAPRLHRLVVAREPPSAAGGDTAPAGDSIVLNAAVLAPMSRAENGRIGSYRIGDYPEETYRDLPRYREPRGVIRLTRETRAVRVSPHFRLGQFPAKGPDRWPRYLALQERLLLKLELLAERARERGLPDEGWQVLSGYRSPWYNRSIGQPVYSRHQYGDAADVYLDADGDGRMDDLNGDGRVDRRDADVIYDIVAGMDADPALEPLVGGLGRYGSTAARGPFVHLDTRGYPARW